MINVLIKGKVRVKQDLSKLVKPQSCCTWSKKQMNQVSMSITEHKYWNKISFGCNKHQNRRTVKIHPLPSWWNAQMVFHAKLQKEILNYSMIIFEHSMADNHILTKVFLITFGYTQYLKDLIIFQLTRKLKNKTPGESGSMTQVWKNLLDCRETFSMLKSIVIKFWMTEIVPEDLSLPKKLQRNYSHYSPC